MTGAIDFYFDFSSPYAYLGSCLIETVAEKHGRKVNWHPFMLGVAMKGEKTFPLTQYPLKGEYSRMDFDRTARLYGIPFNMPDEFPKLTLAASRGFLIIAKKDPEQAITFAKKVFTAYFVDGKDISDKDLVADIAAGVGLDRDQFLKDIEGADVKEAFTQSVEDIVHNRKVFGAPFFIVDGEAFWGADRVSQLDRWLEVGGW
ncbi:MAG: 2-hydroxychromene-2-carboxylate isomerase [Proteobacteria bacterium]|nr:2-hydroxychromene-2-carboxylate isomerase [Pseudomonadota bacterium]